MRNQDAKLFSEGRTTSTYLVMPSQTNPNGTLFGGVLMAWVDMAACICAQKHAGVTHVVTAAIDRLDFFWPLKVGDHARVCARVDHVGRSSLSIHATVEKVSNDSESVRLVAETFLTFVALDGEGCPVAVPPVAPADEADRQWMSLAALRVRCAKRFRKWWSIRRAEFASGQAVQPRLATVGFGT